jgi:Fe-S cluster biogenesis protein NfuA
MSPLLEVSQSALRMLQEVLPPAAAGTPAVRVTARLAGPGDQELPRGVRRTPAYDLAPADGPAPGDTVIDLGGLVVYVDPLSAPLVAGVRIDHLSTPRATGFLFRPSDARLAERVRTALETVRPQLQADGGDVELVEVRDARAVLAFQGSCVGCGLAGMTLTRLLEQHLRQVVPELVQVTAETLRPDGVSMLGRSVEPM